MNRTGTIVVKKYVQFLACADQPDQHTDRHPDTGRPV